MGGNKKQMAINKIAKLQKQNLNPFYTRLRPGKKIKTVFQININRIKFMVQRTVM